MMYLDAVRICLFRRFAEKTCWVEKQADVEQAFPNRLRPAEKSPKDNLPEEAVEDEHGMVLGVHISIMYGFFFLSGSSHQAFGPIARFEPSTGLEPVTGFTPVTVSQADQRLQ